MPRVEAEERAEKLSEENKELSKAAASPSKSSNELRISFKPSEIPYEEEFDANLVAEPTVSTNVPTLALRTFARGCRSVVDDPARK